MITLHPEPSFAGKRTIINTAANTRRKRLPEQELTPQQAKSQASRLTRGGLSTRTWRVFDLLATAGVLSSSRIPLIPARTMRDWCDQHLFARLPLEPAEAQEHFAAIGIQEKKPILYTLGLAGVEIAALRFSVAPPSGYDTYEPSRIMHDIAVNEIVLRLAGTLGARGWTVEWLSKYEGVLRDKNEKFILEPDAVVRARKGEQDLAFAIEYHNEDWKTRAFGKVVKYEKAVAEGNWLEQWEVETFPQVLAVFHHAIVGAGYKAAAKKTKSPQGRYYGKKFVTVLEGKLDDWINVANNEVETLLPAGEEAGQ